jgi:hypothetical protein
MILSMPRLERSGKKLQGLRCDINTVGGINKKAFPKEESLHMWKVIHKGARIRALFLSSFFLEPLGP